MRSGMSGNAIGRWNSVQVDCADPVALASFWAQMFGAEVGEPMGDPPQYVSVTPTAPGGPWLSFQRVPEGKTAKNRLHLDVTVDDLDEASARAESLGGRRAGTQDLEEYGFRWRVMSDPEGNEFCLIIE
jgi:predicted enzyme related to lactoylglutathione lyase